MAKAHRTIKASTPQAAPRPKAVPPTQAEIDQAEAAAKAAMAELPDIAKQLRQLASVADAHPITMAEEVHWRLCGARAAITTIERTIEKGWTQYLTRPVTDPVERNALDAIRTASRVADGIARKAPVSNAAALLIQAADLMGVGTGTGSLHRTEKVTDLARISGRNKETVRDALRDGGVSISKDGNADVVDIEDAIRCLSGIPKWSDPVEKLIEWQKARRGNA